MRNRLRPIHSLAFDSDQLRQEWFLSLLGRVTTGCAAMELVVSHREIFKNRSCLSQLESSAGV